MSKQNIIIVVVALVGAFLFFSRQNEMKSNKKSVKPSSEEESIPKVTITRKVNTKRIDKINKTAQKRREQFMKEANLGMDSQSFPMKDGKLSVAVSFRPVSKWCELGDYDYMKAHLAANPSKMLVASVEDLKTNKVLSQQPLSLASMKKGKLVRLQIPTSKTNRLIGFFVCSTPKGKKYGCKSKPTIKFTGLKGAKTKKSSTFYFQTMFVQKDKIKVPPTLANMGDKKFQRNMKNMVSRSERGALKYANKHTEKLGSIPFKFYPKELVITLPYSDPRCKVASLK